MVSLVTILVDLNEVHSTRLRDRIYEETYRLISKYDKQ